MHDPEPGLYAGTATVDITPELGTDSSGWVDLSGYVARIGHATGIHDPLTARALALREGETQALLVVCDLIGFEAGDALALRRGLAAATGIPTDAVMLSCTHTHSGPATLKLHECGEVAAGYLTALRPSLINLARRALTALQPVRLDTGGHALPEGAYNRRQDGEPIDVEVSVARLRAMTGETVALLLSYGCHPVVMTADNRLISADYPGAAVRALESAWGGTAYFLTGACGNVDPVRRGSFEDVAWLGRSLAHAAGQVLQVHAERSDGPQGARVETGLSTAIESLQLPLMPPPSAEMLAALRAAHQRASADLDQEPTAVAAKIRRAMLAWIEETSAQLARGCLPATVTAPVQVLRIGRLVLIGVPGELFSGLGRQIKAALPQDRVVVVGYANQDIGYIPDRAAYIRGGYEVTEAYRYYGAPAALAPEAGEMIVRESVRLATISGGRTS